jgi:MFS family permease
VTGARTDKHWGGLFALAATVGNGVALQGLFGPLQEAAKVEMHLTDFEVSLVSGLAAAIPVAVLAVPLGRMTDRVHRVRLLLALALTWTVGAVMTAYAPNLPVLFLARTLAGIGMFCALPVAISIASDLRPPEERGFAMLLLSIGKIIGVASAFGLAGALLARFGGDAAATMSPWRKANLVFAAGSVMLMIPLVLMREPVRHELGEAARGTLKDALRAIWTRKALLVPLFIGQLCVVMADIAAGVWAAPVLIRNYAQTPEQFGPWFGGILLLTGILGTVIGGLGVDWGQKGRVPGGLLGTAVIAAFIGIPGALFPVMPSVPTFAMALAALLLGGSITGVVTAAAIAVRVSNELRGVTLGVMIVVAAIIGLGVAPTAVTLVSAALGGESHVAEGLAIVGFVTSALSAVGFLYAWRGDRKP